MKFPVSSYRKNLHEVLFLEQECYADVVMDQNHQVRHRMGCRSKVVSSSI